MPVRPPLIASLFLLAAASAQDGLLPPLEVIGGRLGGDPQQGEIASWSRDDLQLASPLTLDELLATEPSFSLYRRQSSWFGNPTSAGVSLRNTGATAASRTLVVFDGVPQNDPFGGWVSWARYDPASLDSLRIIGSSRSTAWGNQSPAGTIQLTSRPPFSDGHSLRMHTGSYGTAGAGSWNQWTEPEENLSIHASAYGFHTDGFQAIPDRQRGPIDEALRTDFAGMAIGGAWQAAPHLLIQPRLSYHWEDRGNGTDLSGNTTEAVDLSLHITSEQADTLWQVLAYHQIREFSSVFSSAAPGRISETIALDQYEVPAQGTGGAWILRKNLHESFSLTGGADLRFLDGETRENAGTFRNRIAGGKQAHQGIFLSPSWDLTDDTTWASTLRMDSWQLTEGRRTETLLATGTIARDDVQPDRDGWEPSIGTDLHHQLHEDLAVFGSAGSSFRLPTLNELHRPFRVRDDVVETNPALDPERFFHLSAGADWQAREDFSMRFEVFHHWIRDAIANVPITDPAEAALLFGPIPPGGSLSQRKNVDLATVAGIEWSARWTPLESVSIGFSQLWSDTRFRESTDQPLLTHTPFPQAPEWRSIATAEWHPLDNLSILLGAEHGSTQFDDAISGREMAAFTEMYLGLRWKHGAATYEIGVENLLDAEIQTGIASNGILTTAAPRMLQLSMNLEF